MIYIIAICAILSLVLAIILIRRGIKDAQEMPNHYEDLSRQIDRVMYNEVNRRKIMEYLKRENTHSFPDYITTRDLKEIDEAEDDKLNK